MRESKTQPQDKGPMLSVVIPVYNEEETLELLYARLAEVLTPQKNEVEIIFVDDGSRDNSWEILKNLHAKDPEIVLIRLKRNFGQTAALAAGFDYARGDIIVTLDADLQNDPQDIPMLLEEINDEVDVVSGWRKDRKDPFWARKFPSLVANKIISWYTGVKLHDYGCTLKAYKRGAIKNLRLYGDLHRFIPALLSWSGSVIKEVPVMHSPRRYGKSKYGILRTVNVLLDLITVKFLLVSSKGPMQIFGRLGLIFSFLGFCSGIVVVIMKVTQSVNMTGNPLLYLTIFLIIMGLQFISIGFLGEINIRIYGRSHGRKIYTIRQILAS